MTAREYPVFTVTPKAERSLRAGHPWVYGEEVTAVEGAYQNGDMVDVVSNKGRYLGTGWVNDHSKIRVRIISRNANDTFDEAFFRRRVCYALNYRKTVMGPVDHRCCRLIFGEADQFPGLTVDRFENILVTQVLSLGVERRKDWVYRALVELLREDDEQIDAIYERNDVAIRTLEGLEQGKGFYQMGEGLKTDLSGHVTITENGIKYDVDYIEGQKDRFFSGPEVQPAGSGQAGPRTPGAGLLYAYRGFCAECGRSRGGACDRCGCFGLCTGAGRRKRKAQWIDQSGIYKCADVFDLLTEMAKEKKCDYDYIILDPPAFTKSRATAKNAYHGYKEINRKAMRLLPRGGYLATCSCSHFMTDEMFRKMLQEAALDAGVTLRQIEARQQAPDHPILPEVPETDYLKFYLLQVV